MEKKEKTIKIFFLFYSFVCKSCLIQYLLNNRYDNRIIPTDATFTCIKTIEINNQRYKLQLWDNPGMENYISTIKLFFTGCTFVVYVYDPFDRDNFTHLKIFEKLEDRLNNEKISKIVLNIF